MAGSMFASRISLSCAGCPPIPILHFQRTRDMTRTRPVDDFSYSVIQKASIGTRLGVYREFVNKGQITPEPDGPADAGTRSATGNRATGVVLIDCQ